jgi:microcystin degradation protein MlrC
VHTTREPGASLVRRLHSLEAEPGIASASLVHGFAWGDVPDMGTRALVYVDRLVPGAQARGEAGVRALADEVASLRQALMVDMPDIDTCLDLALAEPHGPVVVADGSDNAGGGAASDSTFVLQRLLARRVEGAAVAPMWDPMAVRIAWNAGAGAALGLRIGGKVSPMSGPPLDVTCRVLSLVESLKMSGMVADTEVDCGDSVLLEIDGVRVVLVSQRTQAFGTELFTAHGCDPGSLRLIVLKSSQHFRAHFGPIARRVLYCAAPGTLTSDLSQLTYRKVARPRWPLADIPTP